MPMFVDAWICMRQLLSEAFRSTWTEWKPRHLDVIRANSKTDNANDCVTTLMLSQEVYAF